MHKPKLKLPPKTISVRNFKHFDRTEFLDDLQMAHIDEIKNDTEMRCGFYGKAYLLIY